MSSHVMDKVVADLREQNTVLQRKLDAAEAAARDSASKHEARMNSLREEIDDYESAEVELAAVVEDLRAEIDGLQAANAELTTANAELAATNASLSVKAEQASAKRDDARAIVLLERELDAARARIAELEELGGGGGVGDGASSETVIALETELAELKQVLESKQTEWEASMRAKVDTLAELRELAESLTAAGPSAGGDADDIAALKDELAHARAEQEALHETKSRLEVTIADVEGKLIASRMQLGELKFLKEQSEITSSNTIRKLEKKLAKATGDKA